MRFGKNPDISWYMDCYLQSIAVHVWYIWDIIGFHDYCVKTPYKEVTHRLPFGNFFVRNLSDYFEIEKISSPFRVFLVHVTDFSNLFPTLISDSGSLLAVSEITKEKYAAFRVRYSSTLRNGENSGTAMGCGICNKQQTKTSEGFTDGT